MRRKRIMEKDWLLGFFGLFAFYAIPGLMDGEWIWASWLVWAFWFIFFIPPSDPPTDDRR